MNKTTPRIASAPPHAASLLKPAQPPRANLQTRECLVGIHCLTDMSFGLGGSKNACGKQYLRFHTDATLRLCNLVTSLAHAHFFLSATILCTQNLSSSKQEFTFLHHYYSCATATLQYLVIDARCTSSCRLIIYAIYHSHDIV